MKRAVFCLQIIFATAGLLGGTVRAQDHRATRIARAPASPVTPDLSASLPPLKDAATDDQIREYLRLSGDLDSFRLRWISALVKNRSIGEPYWPESFWVALKTKMQKTDLMPMFITLYQHGISKDLMQDVLDAYHTLGPAHFRGSPACFKLGSAELAMSPDMDRLKLAKTQEIFAEVYTVYKPRIKAARARYLAEHPDWIDK